MILRDFLFQHNTMSPSTVYSLGLQYVSNDTPLKDIVSLMKRDGAVVVRNLTSTEALDKTYDEVKDRIDQDLEWDGLFSQVSLV